MGKKSVVQYVPALDQKFPRCLTTRNHNERNELKRNNSSNSMRITTQKLPPLVKWNETAASVQSHFVRNTAV